MENKENKKGITYDFSKLNEEGCVKEEALQYIFKKKPGEYTLEDYYALPDDIRVELIDGEFFVMNAPSLAHQEIISYIHMSFYEYIHAHKKPCKVWEAPVDVQICCDNKNMVQPDVLVICDRDKLRRDRIYGAPDFVLEVLSKSTRKKDMTIKLAKYTEAGVREYWIIDPYKEILIVYDLTDEEYIPVVYPIKGKVPVLISNGELEIDLEPVAESIRELRDLKSAAESEREHKDLE